MEMDFFIKGLIIGFSIAAPVGPIGVMCIRRTLAEGGLAGFVSGLGAATADAVYGIIAVLGVSAASTFLLSQAVWLKLVGGLFLLYLGIKFFINGWNGTKPETTTRRADPGYGAYLQTFALTITSPVTILSFAAIFAGVGLGQSDRDPAAAILLVLGVFMGSAAWWLTLSQLTSVLRSRLAVGRLAWVNRLAGVAMGFFGLAALVSMAA